MQRRGRVDVIAGQKHFHRHGLRDSPDQALGPAAAGKKPRMISGKPKRASGVQIRMSQIKASSRPAARQ